jgi:hypothetical protein
MHAFCFLWLIFILPNLLNVEDAKSHSRCIDVILQSEYHLTYAPSMQWCATKTDMCMQLWNVMLTLMLVNLIMLAMR